MKNHENFEKNMIFYFLLFFDLDVVGRCLGDEKASPEPGEHISGHDSCVRPFSAEFSAKIGHIEKWPKSHFFKKMKCR